MILVRRGSGGCAIPANDAFSYDGCFCKASCHSQVGAIVILVPLSARVRTSRRHVRQLSRTAITDKIPAQFGPRTSRHGCWSSLHWSLSFWHWNPAHLWPSAHVCFIKKQLQISSRAIRGPSISANCSCFDVIRRFVALVVRNCQQSE